MISVTGFVFLHILIINSITNAQNNIIYNISGDVNIALFINDCQSVKELSDVQRTIVNSGIWTTERINYLELISPLTLGLSVYKTCSESELIRTIFDIYQNDQSYVFGSIATKEPSDKVLKLSDVLDIRTRTVKKYYKYVVKAAVRFLNAAGFKKNITLVAADESVIEMFYEYAKSTRICVKQIFIYDGTGSIPLNTTSEDPLIVFGTAAYINQLINSDLHLGDAVDAIANVFVPLDGEEISGFPKRSFVILPPHFPPINRTQNMNIVPTPILFEIAEPLFELTFKINYFLEGNCNDTVYKINCLKGKPYKRKKIHNPQSEYHILKTLKIDPLKQHFIYNLFEVDSSKINDTLWINSNFYLKPYKKIFTYNIFFDNLTLWDETFDPLINDTEEAFYGDICKQGFIFNRNKRILISDTLITFRTESWIYAFVSLALLGILLCLAIIVFLLVAIFRRNILEGNPLLTLLLLLAVILIFASVLPFSIELETAKDENLCLIKAFLITLSYAALFSLLLARSIILGTAAKEIGFMSHISGPVQSFLTLFIFGVQAALNLQFFGRCKEVLDGYNFIYFMSYNVLLLLLLLCLTPLIYRSQRNYREGKYFTIAVILVTLIWCTWIPCFVILWNSWREIMLCFGLVSTGGVCLGAIFIPRTYLMTIAAEREKITSALPSLATATSAMDLYRAHTQPIYDCVNVAAINAAAVVRAGITPSAPVTTLQQPDLYSCPALPEDIDFDIRCDSPASTDKVTRF